jgi:hypothetical protein
VQSLSIILFLYHNPTSFAPFFSCKIYAMSNPTTPTKSDSDSIPSWQPRYTTPPSVQYPYNAAKNALSDLPGVSYALELFLASHMIECEDYCNESDEKKERMYFATGYGLIQCVKGLMSYADEVCVYPFLMAIRGILIYFAAGPTVCN